MRICSVEMMGTLRRANSWRAKLTWRMNVCIVSRREALAQSWVQVSHPHPLQFLFGSEWLSNKSAYVVQSHKWLGRSKKKKKKSKKKKLVLHIQYADAVRTIAPSPLAVPWLPLGCLFCLSSFLFLGTLGVVLGASCFPSSTAIFQLSLKV